MFISGALKDVEQATQGQAAENDNLRNIIHSMEADTNTRLGASDKELAILRASLANAQNISADFKQVLERIYESTVATSNAIRPYIQPALQGAAAAVDVDVHSISSNDDETADLNESADSSRTPAAGQVAQCAQSEAQPKMPEPLPSGSGVAPTAHVVNDSAEVSAFPPNWSFL